MSIADAEERIVDFQLPNLDESEEVDLNVLSEEDEMKIKI